MSLRLITSTTRQLGLQSWTPLPLPLHCSFRRSKYTLQIQPYSFHGRNSAPAHLQTLQLRSFASSTSPLQPPKLKDSKDSSRAQISPSITLYSSLGDLQPLQRRPKTSKKPEPPSLASYSADSRPLAVLLLWLMSKPAAVAKYTQFYLDAGFDVLTVRITPWNLLWPSTCTPIIEQELLPALQSSTHTRKVVHGFSVGGYIFGQLLRAFAEEPDRYGPLVASLGAQVWDSVVDVNGVAVGVSKSVFLRPGLPQRALRGYIDAHMRVFHGVATRYYEEAHEYFYNHPLKAPALFLCSSVDPISTMDRIHAVQKVWKRDAGIDCFTRVWDNTGHVGHMRRYPEEYKAALRSFLGTSGGFGGLASKEAVKDSSDFELEPEEVVDMLDVVGLQKKAAQRRKLPEGIGSVAGMQSIMAGFA